MYRSSYSVYVDGQPFFPAIRLQGWSYLVKHLDFRPNVVKEARKRQHCNTADSKISWNLSKSLKQLELDVLAGSTLTGSYVNKDALILLKHNLLGKKYEQLQQILPAVTESKSSLEVEVIVVTLQYRNVKICHRKWVIKYEMLRMFIKR